MRQGSRSNCSYSARTALPFQSGLGPRATWNYDGTVLYRQSSRIDGTTSGVSAYSESGPNVWKGQYGTERERLTIRWEDGSVQSWEYSVFLDHEGNPALMLQVPGEKPEYFERTGGP